MIVHIVSLVIYEYYLFLLLRTILYLFLSGRIRSGMDSQVLLPMIIAFCLSESKAQRRQYENVCPARVITFIVGLSGLFSQKLEVLPTVEQPVGGSK